MKEQLKADSGLIPVLIITIINLTFNIDVTIYFDTEDDIFQTVKRKVSKYKYLDIVLAFVVGPLGKNKTSF